MRRVPWWAVVSSLAAPVLLIGGWTVAAAVQPVSFDAVVRTISELAARDTPHRWLMTSAQAVARCERPTPTRALVISQR